MKQLLFITFLFLSLNVKSQNNVKDQIVGSWKVENVILKNNKQLNNKDVKDFTQTFKNSIFSFKVNHDFILTLKEQTKVSAMFNEMIKNQKWAFEEKRKMIRIGNDDNRYNLMGIFAKIENNKAIFKIYESEIYLELVRI